MGLTLDCLAPRIRLAASLLWTSGKGYMNMKKKYFLIAFDGPSDKIIARCAGLPKMHSGEYIAYEGYDNFNRVTTSAMRLAAECKRVFIFVGHGTIGRLVQEYRDGELQ